MYTRIASQSKMSKIMRASSRFVSTILQKQLFVHCTETILAVPEHADFKILDYVEETATISTQYTTQYSDSTVIMLSWSQRPHISCFCRHTHTHLSKTTVSGCQWSTVFASSPTLFPTPLSSLPAPRSNTAP